MLMSMHMELESNQDTLINGVVSFRGQKCTIHVFGTVATVLFIEVLLHMYFKRS